MKKKDDSRVTPEEAYLNRRDILTRFGFLGLALATGSKLQAQTKARTYDVTDPLRPPTQEVLALNYNNYYEFSSDKKTVSGLAAKWNQPSQWTLSVGGLVEKELRLDLQELIRRHEIEDRIYRFRCVEAWSMVLPWRGFPLTNLIASVKPRPEAKYVKFVSAVEESVMPNVRTKKNKPWPYTEALTMAEALHPLCFLATGLYRKPLSRQNGAPIRLVVPWKYGFKSIKAIRRIEFTAERPRTFWETISPAYCGFYANVNPAVANPGWSQARETRIDGSLIPQKIPTLLYNGYGDDVAYLYKNLDLKKNI